MLEILKLFFWSLKDPIGRMHFFYEFARDMPGDYGFALRARILRRHFATVGPQVRIHVGTRIRNPHKLSLGNNVTIGVDNFIQAAGEVRIGDHTLLGPGVKIWSTNHVFSDPDRLIREQGAEYKPVAIGSDVWIGSNAFIMPGTEIGDGCIVSAGSVVGAKKYPPFSKLMGNPARVIGSRKPASENDND